MTSVLAGWAPWGVVPVWFPRLATTLTPTEVLVMVLVLQRARGGVARMTAREISDALSLHRGRVCVALRSLRTRGVLAQEAGAFVVRIPEHKQEPKQVRIPEHKREPKQVRNPDQVESGFRTKSSPESGLDGASGSHVVTDGAHARAHARERITQEKETPEKGNTEPTPTAARAREASLAEPLKDQQPTVPEAEPAQLTLVPPAPPIPWHAGASAFFTRWREITGQAKARLDDKREALIRRRIIEMGKLRCREEPPKTDVRIYEFGLAECMLALDGLASDAPESEWAREQDSRCSIEVILRDAANVERFAARAAKAVARADPLATAGLDRLELGREWAALEREFRAAPRVSIPDAPEAARQWDPRLRPTVVEMLGERVLLFGDTLVTDVSLGASAARYARRVLVGRHGQVVAAGCDERIESIRRDLRESYAEELAEIDKHASNDDDAIIDLDDTSRDVEDTHARPNA